MMKLPDVFQFRIDSDAGYTHTASVAGGSVKVKWARGWFESRGEDWHNEMDELWTTCTVTQAQKFVDEGGWVVVEDKKVEQGLPDESLSAKASPQLPSVFYFTCWDEGIVYKATRRGEEFSITWDNPESVPTNYAESTLVAYFNAGNWKIIDHKPLTPEQLRSNAEFREQIAALDHSIRLAYQDIEHKETLIKAYFARADDLRSKLVKEPQ